MERFARPRRLSVTVERFALASAFTISRGSKTEAVVVVVTLEDEAGRGHGESVPYGRYGETPESVAAQLEGVRERVESGESREALQGALKPGAARNALDCALWDLEAKTGQGAVIARISPEAPRPIDTAFTISLASPDEMRSAAQKVAHRKLLKVKVGSGDDDIARMRAVREGAPDSRLIIDANEGWTPDNISSHLMEAAAIHATVVEQPLPSDNDALLASIPHPVPICADESVHATGDLAGLAQRYDFVNLKLDKTGGLTEGLAFAAEARRLGFGLMVGCMVGSSLSMAPAILLAQTADLVDLDGPLLLRSDREHGIRYSGSTVSPPLPTLWG